MTYRRSDALGLRPRDTNTLDLGTLLGRIPAWYGDALCAQVDQKSFYPEKGGSTAPAKAVCRRCPVQTACLEYAIANDEPHGVWGGMSPKQRRRLAGKEVTR